MKEEEKNVFIELSFCKVPNLNTSSLEPLWSNQNAQFTCRIDNNNNNNNKWKPRKSNGSFGNFASLSVADNNNNNNNNNKKKKELEPSLIQLAKHPLALIAYIPRDVAVFLAGAGAGAAAKTLTAPLDRVKLLMQTHGLRAGQEASITFVNAIKSIAKQEGIKGYWKGNLPQIIRVVPYSAVQLLAYETYKKLFKGKDGQLTVIGRLAAGACAGMTSTFMTYPLDVLRLRLAVEPGYRSMTEVALNMLREEGFASFYYGLGPSLISIAPYIAINFCIFDLVKKSLPEKYQQKAQSSLLTAVVSAAAATLVCYPLDTVRRQMQMRGSPYKTILDAFPGIIERDGVAGLYRGFLPNALKTLPNSSIRLTTFDMVKRLITTSEEEFQKIVEENSSNQTQDANVEHTCSKNATVQQS